MEKQQFIHRNRIHLASDMLARKDEFKKLVEKQFSGSTESEKAKLFLKIVYRESL